MKKGLLLLFSLCMIVSMQAQNCLVDESLPDTFLGVSPLPPLDETTYVPDNFVCIGIPYEYTFTAQVPTELEALGTTIELYSVEITAVNGLPEGLNYVCEPADCIFPGGQPGCLKVEGTAAATVAVGDYPIEIVGTVQNNLGFPLEVTFPDESGLLPPEYSLPYVLRVTDDATQCSGTSTDDLFTQQVSVAQNSPNPFSGITNIKVNAEAGDYDFQVFNMAGELVHNRSVYIAGEQNIQFDGSRMEAGVYMYTLSNELGSITKRMVIK